MAALGCDFKQALRVATHAMVRLVSATLEGAGGTEPDLAPPVIVTNGAIWLLFERVTEDQILRRSHRIAVMALIFIVYRQAAGFRRHRGGILEQA